MARDILIGIDAGTSVMKAVAFSTEGAELAMAARPNHVLYGPGGAAEQDLPATWADFVAVLRELVQRVPKLAQRCAGIALTGQGDGTWLVDRHHQPVGPAMLWLDGRSGELVRQWQQSGVAAQVAALTGTGRNTSQQSGQLAWLAKHQPERLAQAHQALHCKDVLYLCCTGRYGTDLAEGLFTYGNPRTMAYDDEVLALMGLGTWRHLLPPVVDGRRENAPLSATAAAATGLPEGLPVVLAPMDVPSTALGAGVYAPGRRVGCSILGSTGMHSRMYNSLDEVPASSQQGYLWPFSVPGSFQGAMSHMAATLNLDWLCDRLDEVMRLNHARVPARPDLLKRLEALATQAEPGGALFHPFISEAGERGPFAEPLARAQFSGLSSATSLGALARSVWEGVAFATRDCYEALGLDDTNRPEEIRLTGGAARSPLMRQVLADVMGCPVRVSRRGEAGAAGAAIVGAVSIGLYADVTQATPVWVDALLEPTCTAPSTNQARYNALFTAYRDGYQHQFPLWRSLHQARSHHA